MADEPKPAPVKRKTLGKDFIVTGCLLAVVNHVLSVRAADYYFMLGFLAIQLVLIGAAAALSPTFLEALDRREAKRSRPLLAFVGITGLGLLAFILNQLIASYGYGIPTYIAPNV